MTLFSLPTLQILLLLAMFLIVIWLAIWAFGKILEALGEPVAGPENKLIGQKGRVNATVGCERGGKVVVAGEIWDAVLSTGAGSAQPGKVLAPDTLVKVIGFDPVDPRTLQIIELDSGAC